LKCVTNNIPRQTTHGYPSGTQSPTWRNYVDQNQLSQNAAAATTTNKNNNKNKNNSNYIVTILPSQN